MKQVRLVGMWRHFADIDHAVEVTEADLADREALIKFSIGAGARVQFQSECADIVFLQPCDKGEDAQQHFKINRLPSSFSDEDWRK